MKRSKNYVTILFIGGFLISTAKFVLAEEKPGYVGIQEGQEYIWNINYDEDVMEQLFEDGGYPLPEDDIDIEAIKIKIENIDDEEKIDYYGSGVNVDIEYYTTKNRAKDVWVKDASRDATIIWEYDDDIYVQIAFLGIFFIATNPDWPDAIEEASEQFDDMDVDWEVVQNWNGIQLTMDSEGSMEEIIITSRYTPTGVLDFYEIIYDGKRACTLQLEGSINYILIGSIITIGIIVSIVSIIIVKVRKSIAKTNRMYPTQFPDMSSPEYKKMISEKEVPYAPKNYEPPPIEYLCNRCGRYGSVMVVKNMKEKFCRGCGAIINEDKS